MIQLKPFLGCVFATEKIENIFLVLVDYTSNNKAVFVMASKVKENISKNDVITNIKKDFDISLMAYTKFEMPYDGLYDFKIMGFIPHDAVFQMNEILSQLGNKDVSLLLLEQESDTYIESLEELFITRSAMLDIAAHAPMAVPNKIRIEDFSVESFSLESLRFDFFWYPDSIRAIRLFFDKNSGKVEVSNFLNNQPNMDAIFINDKKIEFDNNGHCVLSIEQVDYFIQLFQLPTECSEFLIKKNVTKFSLLEIAGKQLKSLFDAPTPLRDKSLALASSKSIQKSSPCGDGTIEIMIDSDGVGKIISRFHTPQQVYIQFIQLSDEKIVPVGRCGEDSQEYLQLTANKIVEIWIDEFDGDNTGINIFNF